MECTECGGQGCEECDETGKIYVADCPLITVPAETWEFISAAEMYIEHGLPPAAGGQLDQAAAFIEGAAFVEKHNNFWKTKLKIRD